VLDLGSLHKFKAINELGRYLNDEKRGQNTDVPISRVIETDLAASYAEQTKALASYLFDKASKAVGWIVFYFCLAVMGTISRRDEENESRRGTVVSRKLREYWILVLKESTARSGAYVRVVAECCHA